jgi:ABC-type multidrug transport system fused ATPase/permease subunit
MIKARLNSVLFQLLWSCAPVLVSITSFLVFVWQGNELTVSIAFTVRLFICANPKSDQICSGDCPVQHDQAPSQYYPDVDCPNITGKQSSKSKSFHIQHLALQTKVALDRIATYLGEDEVDEQVSSLKKSRFGTSAGDDDIVKGLGIENGTFKWNEVEQKDDDTSKDAKSVASPSTEGVVPDTNDETERGSVTASEAGEQRFELRDIDIMFPERQLTVVTGPTASGKTALLVSLGDPAWKVVPHSYAHY